MILRDLAPWPSVRPDVPRVEHGWFGGGNQILLGRYLSDATRTVVELGSWVGQSTRWFLDTCPDADVIAVDHWEGGADHHASDDPEVRRLLPVLYETFVANLWEYRERLYPLRSDTVSGMLTLGLLGVRPDLVYVDASHITADVYADITTARAVFPFARLTGDDYAWGSVRAAVDRYAGEHGLRVDTYDSAWVYL